MGTILGFLLRTVSGPVLQTLLDGWKAKLAATTDRDKVAADLASREIAVQQAELQSEYALRTSEIGHFWEPEKLAFYLVLLYMAKVIVWDTVLGWGTTDPIKGEVHTWMQLVMTFYFGKRGFENVSRIISSRWGGK